MRLLNKSLAVQIFVGAIQRLPQSGRPSGIYKKPVNMPVYLDVNGFEGDQQADLRVHGGPDKAVQLYPAGHYEALIKRFPELLGKLAPGSIGENISCLNLEEHDVHIGDLWQLGKALLQISQPRSPCSKIDEKLECNGVAAYIAQSSKTGWYFRVLEPGIVTVEDKLSLVESGDESYRLSSIISLMQQSGPTVIGTLQQWMTAPGIADNLRLKIQNKIAQNNH